MLEHPDFMREHPFTELDEDGVAPSPSISHRLSSSNKKLKSNEDDNYYSSDVTEQKSHTGLFNSAFDSTILAETENDDIWGQLEYMHSTLSPQGTLSDRITSQKGDENTNEFIATQTSSVLETISPKSVQNTEVQMFGESGQPDGDWDLEVDNMAVIKKPINTGFLVSFIADARGGLIQARRYPDLRIFIPPNVINGPLRIVCRLVHPDRMNSPPIMNDGDGLACRLLEIGPAGIRFASPILFEIPHYAFLNGKNREIVILRSDNGETWKEHPLDATDQAVQDTLNGHFDYAGSFEELRAKSIHRILTYDLPQYFALITRIKQELILIGPEGGTLTSTVVPDVHVRFPQGALQKRIRVGLQVHPVDHELVTRMLGPRVSVSPIVTIEPRRRKFHKPITLTIPLPKTAMSSSSGVADTKSRSTIDSPSLRLLCSITGGTSPAVWEDITGSSPLSAHDLSVSFTSTVSARLWLVDCPNITEVVELASRVYHESLAVPYIGQFIVYARRFHPEEAQLRCLCLTDDSAEKTLELQEGFQLIATGPCIEVLDDHPHWIETAGNLVPVAKTEEQLQLGMHAFRENRLNMIVRVKDLSQPAVGKLAFMRHPRAVLQSAGSPVKPATVLEAKLPDEFTDYMTDGVLKTTDIDDMPPYIPEYNQNGGQYTTYNESLPQTWSKQDHYDEPLAKSELDLRQVAYHLKSDWRILAQCLGLSDEDQYNITSLPNRPEEEYAYTSLLLWQERSGNELTSGTQLAEALQAIGRKDILEYCMTNISPVITADERVTALRSLNAVSPNLNINRENRSHSKDGSGGLSESVDTGYGTQTGSTTLIPTTPVITKTISSTIHTLPTSSNVDNSKQSEQEVEQEIIQPVTVTTGRIYSGSLPYVGKSITDVPEDKYDVLKGVENILVDSQHSSTIEDDKINSTSTGPPVNEEIVVPTQINRTVQLNRTDDTTNNSNNIHKQIEKDSDLSNIYTDDDNIIQNNMEKVMKSNQNYYDHSDKLNDDIYEFSDRVIAIPQMDPVDSTEILFDDTYYNNMLGDLLQGRSTLEPLTPIPETSEYSTRSSVTSINPSKSWQSSDLSPSDSIEIRPGGGAVTNVSRRLLHPFSHSNRTSHESFSGPQKSFKNPALSVHSISSIHSEPDRIRRSYEAHSMESPGQDCHMDLSSSLRTHSSRSSSLAEFLRLETSCDGSRGDLCIDVDNDDDKRLCEHDQNLHDLIQSIQELQRQHLDESMGLITPPSGDEDSSNSRLAIGSNDIDRQIGESIRNAELESSVSLLSASSLPQVNTTSKSEMQQLLQPIYMSSSSLNSSAPQPSPPSTTTAKLPVGITCRVNQYF
ncbi:unnamed protein product [Schistosoma intercalatum]|nr:unnamed protein product [Schistosoma intercalatum]CAH8618414.1 unnamed protein product [Schistosoma intercalatum]